MTDIPFEEHLEAFKIKGREGGGREGEREY